MLFDSYKKMGFHTIDLTGMDAFDFPSKADCPKFFKLRKVISSFINLNKCSIKSISFSPKFDKEFHEEENKDKDVSKTTSRVYCIRTLVGDAVVVIKHDQEADVICHG